MKMSEPESTIISNLDEMGEQLKRIAEQLEQHNQKIEVFESVAVELAKLNKNLENLNFNLVKG